MPAKIIGPLVNAGWLQANLGSVEIADVRWSMAAGPKLDEFLQGHIPGSVFVDLDHILSEPPGPRGRHPLPTVERFRRDLGALGLGRRPTVCYDDSSGATASRLWWMLDAIGHPCAVLDGGIAAWTGSLDGSANVEPQPHGAGDQATIGDPTVDDWPLARVVDAEALPDRIEAGAPLLDARSADRFRGEPNAIDPVAGHVPGARSRPWTDNVGPDGRFLTAAELAQQFATLGVAQAGEWMASCGSGVTACHNLLAARVAGITDGRLYPGSWSEWISDPSRPVEVGPAIPPDA